ncbi:phage terminase large subunit family protein [Vibrio vulnificus]|uniref:phage terminase large subunit family protein n=2 Tax=Vibrio vulnificus TaxID=672 RepID=UPI001FAF9A8C|nr:terminase gpA endonuclease subunit [Vibrio vulnificus]MCJ0806660.1 phage terminase large subunit family protein [Vibrio vulnificus]
MLVPASDLRREVAQIFKAPNRMPVAEAVSKYMRVPIGGGNSVPWDKSLTPYIIEPMNCLTSREYDAVVFVGPARTGKTIGLVDGWVVYTVVCDPSDMLVVQLTEEKAREYSRKRLDRAFRVSPEVACRLSPRGNDNNVHDKIFRAGNYLKLGWPSINILSSSDYRFAAITDYDRWPDDIDGEGDGYSLTSKRTTTYMSSGMTLVESSPGKDIKDVKWKASSPHEAPPCTGILSLYNRGDRRRWYWPCPYCGEAFQPNLANMKRYEGIEDMVLSSESARIECPHCHEAIEPSQKRELNNQGIWLKEGQTWCKETQSKKGEGRRSRLATFWMEGPAAAYQTWAQLVYKLLAAEQEYDRTGSEDSLRAVINTDWGLPYLPKVATELRQSEELIARAESWERKTVPNGVRFLLAAVDVQGGKSRRFVVQVVGYGENGERWVIDRFNIRSSLRMDDDGVAMPIDPGAFPEDWQILIHDVLNRTYQLSDRSGRKMRVMAMAVDHGGEDGVSNNAYAFWRYCRKLRLNKRVYLFKGDSHARQKTINKTFPDNTGRADRKAEARGDVPLYLLQTDQLKDRVSSCLTRDTVGPNYIHFPKWMGEWFYDELTYEERGQDGKWRKPGKGANEAFDLMCYCHALAMIKGYEKIDWNRPKPWASAWDENPEVYWPDTLPTPIEDTQQKTIKKPKPKSPSSPAESSSESRVGGDWLSGGNSGGRGGWL